MVALAVSLASAAAAFQAHSVWQPQQTQQVRFASGLQPHVRPRVASNLISAKVEEKERTATFPDLSSLGDAITGKDNGKKNNKPSSPPSAPFLNKRLFAQLVLSQLTIGGFANIQSNGATWATLVQNSHFGSPAALALGVAAALPLIGLGRVIEESDSEDLASINLSTDLIAYSLFGKNTQPAFALAASAFMCTLTGVVEETVFRGQVMPNLFNWLAANNWVDSAAQGLAFAGVLSSVLFAAGHLNFGGGLRNLVSAEARTLFTLQFFNGLTFATLYGLTGDLTAPIIAHALYDLSALYGTHLRVTKQLSYAEEQAGGRPKTPMDAARRTFYLMDRNKDGFVSPRELRIGLYFFGIIPPRSFSDKLFGNVDIDGDGRISEREFLRQLKSNVEDGKSPEEAAGNAMKRSVLGVQM
uniref:EF-hand domain-containing protein n=1 Tax=Chrysotila carterae TaxID=13221 RepID=A0A7S4B6P6_CHRCT|mmetsp:Transcript_40226/g.84358  ORF Transcript_40226/g.84358 Transcript_40226/m.84358 type:complete len:414 (-) Transcript_40226:407-1648(-)